MDSKHHVGDFSRADQSLETTALSAPSDDLPSVCKVLFVRSGSGEVGEQFEVVLDALGDVLRHGLHIDGQ